MKIITISKYLSIFDSVSLLGYYRNKIDIVSRNISTVALRILQPDINDTL